MQDGNAVYDRERIWVLPSKACPPQGLCRVPEATQYAMLCHGGGDKEPGGNMSRRAGVSLCLLLPSS